MTRDGTTGPPGEPDQKRHKGMSLLEKADIVRQRILQLADGGVHEDRETFVYIMNPTGGGGGLSDFLQAFCIMGNSTKRNNGGQNLAGGFGDGAKSAGVRFLCVVNHGKDEYSCFLSSTERVYKFQTTGTNVIHQTPIGGDYNVTNKATLTQDKIAKVKSQAVLSAIREFWQNWTDNLKSNAMLPSDIVRIAFPGGAVMFVHPQRGDAMLYTGSLSQVSVDMVRAEFFLPSATQFGICMRLVAGDEFQQVVNVDQDYKELRKLVECRLETLTWYTNTLDDPRPRASGIGWKERIQGEELYLCFNDIAVETTGRVPEYALVHVNVFNAPLDFIGRDRKFGLNDPDDVIKLMAMVRGRKEMIEFIVGCGINWCTPSKRVIPFIETILSVMRSYYSISRGEQSGCQRLLFMEWDTLSESFIDALLFAIWENVRDNSHGAVIGTEKNAETLNIWVVNNDVYTLMCVLANTEQAKYKVNTVSKLVAKYAIVRYTETSYELSIEALHNCAPLTTIGTLGEWYPEPCKFINKKIDDLQERTKRFFDQLNSTWIQIFKGEQYKRFYTDFQKVMQLHKVFENATNEPGFGFVNEITELRRRSTLHANDRYWTLNPESAKYYTSWLLYLADKYAPYCLGEVAAILEDIVNNKQNATVVVFDPILEANTNASGAANAATAAANAATAAANAATAAAAATATANAATAAAAATATANAATATATAATATAAATSTANTTTSAKPTPPGFQPSDGQRIVPLPSAARPDRIVEVGSEIPEMDSSICFRSDTYDKAGKEMPFTKAVYVTVPRFNVAIEASKLTGDNWNARCNLTVTCVESLVANPFVPNNRISYKVRNITGEQTDKVILRVTPSGILSVQGPPGDYILYMQGTPIFGNVNVVGDSLQDLWRFTYAATELYKQEIDPACRKVTAQHDSHWCTKRCQDFISEHQYRIRQFGFEPIRLSIVIPGQAYWHSIVVLVSTLDKPSLVLDFGPVINGPVTEQQVTEQPNTSDSDTIIDFVTQHWPQLEVARGKGADFFTQVLNDTVKSHFK